MGRLISDYYPPPPNSFHYRGRFSAWRYVFGEDQRPSSFTVASKISESLRKDCRIESHFVEVYIKATGQSKVEVTVRWNSLVNRLQKNGFRVNVDGVQYNSYLHDVTSQPWLIERLLGGRRANPDYDLSISVSSMSRVKLHLGDELSCGTPHPLFSPMVSANQRHITRSRVTVEEAFQVLHGFDPNQRDMVGGILLGHIGDGQDYLDYIV